MASGTLSGRRRSLAGCTAYIFPDQVGAKGRSWSLFDSHVLEHLFVEHGTNDQTLESPVLLITLIQLTDLRQTKASELPQVPVEGLAQ